ncbi:unnamed protein product [Linum trigynum]
MGGCSSSTRGTAAAATTPTSSASTSTTQSPPPTCPSRTSPWRTRTTSRPSSAPSSLPPLMMTWSRTATCSSDTLAWSSTVGRGGQNWKLAALHELDMDYIVKDTSYSRGKLFLVGSGNRFVVVDVIFGNNHIYHSDDMNKQIIKVKPSSQVFYLSREMLDKGDREDESRFSNLCHLDDDFPLVIISRCTKDGGVTFRCYKLVLLERGGGVCSRDEGIEWKEVTSLHGFSVFLGSHKSFALGGVADNNGVNYGVGANRVYFSFCFAEHGLFMNHEMFWSCHQNKCGVLDLGGGGEVVEWFHPCRGLGDHNYVWFLPSPW